MLQAHKTDPHICARCHHLGRGCCVLHKGEADSMFGLTMGEIKFISRASGLKPRQFMEQDEISPEFEKTLSRLHPVFQKTIPDRKRLRLKVNQAGQCVFLGPKGCRLPEKSRPLYCRLYPFWFTTDNRLMVMISSACLAQEGAASWREVLARMGMEEAALRELFTQLLQLASAHQAWHQEGGGF
jgi:Fe-S-cluster containining protein